MMNQDRFSLETFLATAEGRTYDDVILMADSEATAAERRRLRLRNSPFAGESLGYANQLKALIRYMRYGIKPKGLSPEQVGRLQRLRGHALQKKPGRSPRPNDLCLSGSPTWRPV